MTDEITHETRPEDVHEVTILFEDRRGQGVPLGAVDDWVLTDAPTALQICGKRLGIKIGKISQLDAASESKQQWIDIECAFQILYPFFRGLNLQASLGSLEDKYLNRVDEAYI